MSNYELSNAKIESTQLGVQCTDHGVLGYCIFFDYGGSAQGSGHIVMDTYDKAKERRVPTTLAAGLLMGIDEVFGVDWEKLPGLPCRVYHSWSDVRAFGHYLKDKWLWYDETAIEFKVTPFADVPKGPPA